MQYVVIVPNTKKRITLLPNVSAKFIDQPRREIMYTTTDLTALIWQLLVNMPEREAVKLLAAIEMEDNDQ
jgi:hypothetical protein